MKPRRISVRPAIGSEGEGIVIWVYHRKVQIQIAFDHFDNVNECIDYAVDSWQHAMSLLKDV